MRMRMCMCMCMYVSVYIYIYDMYIFWKLSDAYNYICLCEYKYAYIHTYIPTYVRTYIHTHICVRVYIYMYIYMINPKRCARTRLSTAGEGQPAPSDEGLRPKNLYTLGFLQGVPLSLLVGYQGEPKVNLFHNIRII